MILFETKTGEVIQKIEGAHGGAVWSMDCLAIDAGINQGIHIMSGGADKHINFY